MIAPDIGLYDVLYSKWREPHFVKREKLRGPYLTS